VSMFGKVRVATAQYCVERLRGWDQFQAKLSAWTREAAVAGARLLVFPEYAGMEAVPLADRRQGNRRSPSRHTLGPLPVAGPDRRRGCDLQWEAQTFQATLPAFLQLHSELAALHRVYLLAGSLPVHHALGSLRNTAFFFAPDGSFSSQDKMVPTRWEREMYGMTGGEEVRVFQTDMGPVGVAICYDSEFPIIARCQAEARARIILAPTCTESLRGFYRVRVGARARALENQCYVVQASTIGDAPWSQALGSSVGCAAVYAPPDLGPRENGVLVQGPMNEPRWVYADLDLDAIDRIRGGESIANADDWTAHLRVGPAVYGQFRPMA